MINQTILYLVHTNCSHPKLAPYAKELGVSVNWNPDLRLGIPLSKVFERAIRYDVGSDYAEVGTGQTNLKIIELVREHKPKYVIWPTMNYEIQEETFQMIRQLGSYVIGWFFDDECRFDEYSRWWIPYMDYFFTCDKASISRYQALGAKALNILVTADPDYFKPTPTDLKFEVSFVGTRSVADREHWFDLLTNEGIEVFAIGKGWPGGYISNDEILKVYSSSKINICFTKSYGVNTRNQIKDKIFDITMCGGFLLCEYVDGIEYLFDIGKEIICFENYSDALSKIRYYLNNGAEREIIAKAGMLRSTAEYSQQKLLKKAFDIIEADTASKTKRFSCSGVDTTPPDNILKLKELYHYRWAQVLQETGFDVWRYEEEYQLARNYSISTKRPASVLLVQLTYPSSPFPGPNLPVGLGYIAEQLELNGIPYDVADLSIESIEDFFSRIKESAPDYIGLSMMSLDIDSHYGLAVEIKKLFPGTKIIAGGAHISFVREKALLDCPAIDFGIAHEGEHALVELLNGNPLHSIKGLLYRAQDGAIIYSGNRELIDDLDSLPFPRYQKFKLSRYGQTIALASSRGCPFSCTFCGAFLSMGRKWRARSVQNIVGELEYWQQKGYKNFNFIDSNFFMSIQRVNDLCDALSIRDIKITLTSDGMRAKDADPIMLKKLKQFGLQSVAIGIESANDDILNSIKKGETLADLELCMKTLLDLDINVIAFFIIGLPGETVQHVLNSFAFALKYPNIRTAYFFNPNPLPGTELYAYAKQHQMLKATESQIFDNIGGMGNQILLETEELPVSVRRKLLELSHHVSQMVELRHRLHREQNTISDSDRLNIENGMQSINSKINQSVAMLNEPINYIELPMTKYENIFTHLTYEEKYKLQELANTTRGRTYVELGSYLGASSCFIASGIQSSGITAKLYCIDTWNNDAMSEGNRNTYTEFLENTEEFQGIVVPLRGRSEEVAKTFDKEIDFLFIDAGHEYENVKADVLAWFPKLRLGALVIFHDIGWAEGVQRIVKEYIQPIARNESLLPNMYWANINTLSSINHQRDTENLIQRLLDVNISVARIDLEVEDFISWLSTYREIYNLYSTMNDVTIEKCLEHYISYKFTGVSAGDIYIDIAASGSNWSDCLLKRGVNAYSLDLGYPEGTYGNKIGANAAATGLPDSSVNAMSLQCAFETFRGDCDKLFVKESRRILKDGGKVVISPLYLDSHHFIMSSKNTDLSSVPLDVGSIRVWREDEYDEEFSRHYSPEALSDRIFSNLEGLSAEVFYISNLDQFRSRFPGQRIYCDFNLFIEKPSSRSKNTVLLSVIIPTRNRAALLYNALESLTSQTYPPECFEIIVIDNGSTDSTVEVCRHFKRRLPHFKCVYDPRPGLHNGRHTGLEEANGDILVYADDDIEALPTWLEGIAESFVDPSVVLVGGKVLPKFESTPPEWIDLLSARTDAGWTLAWYSLLDFGDTAHEIPHEYVWGCNFSIRKDVLRKAGGFHPDSVPQELIKYRGDGETAVSFAIRDLGLKAMYNPKATVYHVVSTARMTVDYIYQRAFNQGVSNSYTSIRNSCVLSPPANYAPTTETILEAVNRGIVDGFNYHQQEVQADSTLREWVFRENYFGDNGLIGGKTADNHNLPKTIQISVSDVCNFKCTSCWIHGPGVTADDKNLEASLFKESKPQIMDIKVYERLVSDLKKSSRPVSISFCGKGEPTLHPRFLDMVKFAYNNGLPSNITTNGSGLTFDMLKELREMQVTLNISLNACNQESHQIFCNIQKDFFNSIIEMLRFFSGSEYSGFISLSFVIGSHNIGNIKKMVELSTGILPPGSAISFYPEWTHTGNHENRVSIGQIGSLLDDLSEVINILSNYNISHNLNLLPYVLYGISVSNDNDEPTRDYYMQNPCSTVDNFMVVLADGRVVPCCRSAYVYGNINERNIFDIWSDRKSIEFRSLAKNICNIKKEAPNSHCFSCDHIMGNDYFITRYHSDIDALMSTRLKHD